MVAQKGHPSMHDEKGPLETFVLYTSSYVG